MGRQRHGAGERVAGVARKQPAPHWNAPPPMTARKVRPVKRRLGVEPAEDRSPNLLEWLYQLRDYQREHQRNGAWLIKGKDLPWEHNRQCKMKWFLHPALDNTSIRSMLFLMQDIPPRGKSG